MYFTDDSLFPENMQPLIITAAPYGPEWLPGDISDLPLTWDQQVQAAVDCYNAGATMLHFHVRDPKTGQGSTNFEHYNYLLGRLRQAVPKLILQVGGSISFAPHTDDAKAKWLDYDTRHMLAQLEPKPEFVTVTTGTTLWDVTMGMTAEDIKGTHLDNPKVLAAWRGMVVDSTPAFYVEHLKRLRANRSNPTSCRARFTISRSSSGSSAPVNTWGRSTWRCAAMAAGAWGAIPSTGWSWCAARRTGLPA